MFTLRGLACRVGFFANLYPSLDLLNCMFAEEARMRNMLYQFTIIRMIILVGLVTICDGNRVGIPVRVERNV